MAAESQQDPASPRQGQASITQCDPFREPVRQWNNADSARPQMRQVYHLPRAQQPFGVRQPGSAAVIPAQACALGSQI
jgi:hypothetical protein